MFPSWNISGLWNGVNPPSTDFLPLWANMLVMISHPPPTIEHLQIANDFVGAQKATQQ